jgi:hypothetical protein
MQDSRHKVDEFVTQALHGCEMAASRASCCKPGNRFYVVRKTGFFVNIIYRQLLENPSLNFANFVHIVLNFNI